MKRERIIALTLCLGLVLVLTVSSVFMIHEADHDCIGEGCEICVRIAAAAHLLRSLSLLGVMLSALFAALSAARKYCRLFHCAVRPMPTLVGWKVRLNN